MTRPARVVLRKNLARSIRQGHPWLYREALRPAEGLIDGDVVEVVTADGRALARGYWDATSPIAVRIVCDERTGDVHAVVAERVAPALTRRLAFIDLKRTDAFRWIHGEADGLPGVHVDLYGLAAVLRFDGAGARAFYRVLPQLLAAVAARHRLNLSAVVERRRGARPEGETAVALLGAVPEGEIEVRENGLAFGVDLSVGQKGGLFLDQRDNRERVGALAAGKRVLNLFGYTGGFSLYAAAGGARETVTVDVARGAIAAARRNFARNQMDVATAHFHAEDVFLFLEHAAREGKRWDLVISDPPSFAPSRKALPRALAAYRRLHRLCAAVIAPGGLFGAASCSSHVDRAALLATVEQGVREAKRRWSLRESHGASPDHPVARSFPEGDYLKFAIGEVE